VAPRSDHGEPRACRRFGAAEDEQITDLRLRGWGLGRIAAQVGRAKSSVQMRLNTLAQRDEDADG
jgi:hypothetical protein